MTIVSQSHCRLDSTIVPSEPVKRFSVEEYDTLIRLGILREEDPYELIEGWLVTKMTKNPPHEFAVEVLNRFFMSQASQEWRCRCQQCITLHDGQPEPDIAIVTGAPVRKRHPTADEVLLVVEVADTSLSRDRTIKLRSYARAKIAEYWIVNVLSNEVEVFTQPSTEGSYEQRQVYQSHELLPFTLKDTTYRFDVRTLFEE